MDEKQLRKNELRELIKKYDTEYFLKDTSTISDSTYDDLKRELEELEINYPDDDLDSFEKDKIIHADINSSNLPLVRLNKTMLSLAKKLSHLEYQKWVDKLPPDTELVYEVKLDGLGLDLSYEDGELKSINTRGSGFIGEDVTSNLRLISNIPTRISTLGVVNIRGEAYLTNSSFDVINEMTDGRYTSIRAAASGIIRTIDNQTFKEPVISFSAYQLISDEPMVTYLESRNKLIEYGFDVPYLVSENEIINNIRAEDIPTDGIVVKVNDIKLQEELGNTSTSPRWAIAYKFPNYTGTTTVIGDEWTVGMTGSVTPVIKYEPVKLGFITSTNSTLYNYRSFANLGLAIGSVIEVALGNDVIPKIIGVVKDGHTKLQAPKNCPSCKEPLEYQGSNDEKIHLYCVNDSCEGQLVNRTIQFAGKHGFDMKGLGKVIIGKLVKNKVITNPIELFSLTYDDFFTKCDLGPTVSATLVETIKNCKKVPVNKLLVALAVSDLGTGTANRIVENVTDKDKLLDLITDYEALSLIKDIGWVTAMSIRESMLNKGRLGMLTYLFDICDVVFPKVGDVEEESILICVTGGLSLPRDRVKEMLEENNIEVGSNLTKKTKVLVTGNNPSMSKITRASELGIPVVQVNSTIDDLVEQIKLIKG